MIVLSDPILACIDIITLATSFACSFFCALLLSCTHQSSIEALRQQQQVHIFLASQSIAQHVDRELVYVFRSGLDPAAFLLCNPAYGGDDDNAEADFFLIPHSSLRRSVVFGLA